MPEELGIKPITIIVTSKQNLADSKAKAFKKFLRDQRKMTNLEVDDIVLSVHSGQKAAVDRMKLSKVNDKGNPVEFIFSVSMLTEGWDVKRVFQIVPDDERAFNSKLLIAQVLGRGLRVPDGWDTVKWGTPTVTIFNHEKWSSNVETLVNEVLEIRQRLTLSVNQESDYNFSLMNVRYSSKADTKDFPKMGTYNLWENGVNLPTDDKIGKSTIILTDIKNSSDRQFQTTYEHELVTVQEMANILYSRFEDLEDSEYMHEYQNLWPVSKIQSMIEESLRKSGNTHITKSLKNKFLSSMNVIFRDASKVVTYDIEPKEFFEVSTRKLPKNTTDISGFKINKVLFYSSDLEEELSSDRASLATFKELTDTSNGYKYKYVDNKYNFKTPQFGIVTTGNPEKEFLSKLTTDMEVVKNIDGFIKSDDMNFYSIDYSWQKGTHHKNGQFNPDWFIKQGDNIIAVEIKDDSQIYDPDTENIGKYKAATKHFELLNEYSKEKGRQIRYKITFLTPKDFDIFFKRLIEKNVMVYNSQLDVKLAETNV